MNRCRGILLVITGPTAVGKTAVSLRIVRETGGEIISADSMLIYRGMDIGTAKPSPEERSAVKHHIIDVVDPDGYYSAADYGRAARGAVNEVFSRGNQPIMVGGSGLYIRAALVGIFDGPSADRELRDRLEAEAEVRGSEQMHADLSLVDPAAAVRINPNDLRRIVRALEVFQLTGKPISSFFSEEMPQESPFRPLVFGLAREKEELVKRIHRRVDIMMERGWLQEVERLLSQGYTRHLVSMQSFGYRHLVSHLAGEMGLKEAVELIKRDTRRFAKRQMTWFRKMEGLRWLDLTTLPGGEGGAAEIILEELRECGN